LNLILKNGANPEINSTEGINCLEIAVLQKNEKMLDILLDSGALTNKANASD